MTIFCLVACHDKNPLTELPAERVGKLLWRAADMAEKTLHVSEEGGLYIKCVDRKADKKICKKIFSLMLKYLQNSIPNLTLASLQDRHVIDTLLHQFNEARFVGLLA